MRRYALINDGVVVSTVSLEVEELEEIIKDYNSVIDIEDCIPQPNVGWVLIGNTLELPNSSSDREKMEIDLNDRKSVFGKKLARDAVNRVGARNKILNKNGTQVTALLNQLLGVKMLLETGALGTARYSCTLLKQVHTEYADIFDLVINEVNNFETNFGL